MFLCLFENKRTVLVDVWFTFVQYLPTWTQQYNVPVRTLCTWPEKVPYLILTSAFSAPRVSEPSMYTEVHDEETWAIVLRRGTQHDTIEFAGYAFDPPPLLEPGLYMCSLRFSSSHSWAPWERTRQQTCRKCAGWRRRSSPPRTRWRSSWVGTPVIMPLKYW